MPHKRAVLDVDSDALVHNSMFAINVGQKSQKNQTVDFELFEDKKRTLNPSPS